MKNLHQFLCFVLSISISCLYAQNQENQLDSINYFYSNNIEFVNNNDLLSTSDFQSFLIVGIADMNGDCLDDIIRLKGGKELNIEYQLSNNQFGNYTYGNIDIQPQWNIAIADVDQNGFNDILVGGLMDGMKILLSNDFGTDYTESLLPNSSFFAQGSNFSDIDNDGDADVFVCNDTGENHIWENNGQGIFNSADDWIDMSTDPPSENGGNYASVWTDFDNDSDLDLYISKCKVGVTDPFDPERVNQLFVNENNTFTELAETYGLNIGAQSWTTDFQDIDNDGDLDCFVVNHDSICQLFENIGNGLFEEITYQSGLDITTNHLQGLLRDFDNDGFVDILVAGNYGYEYYRNKGDKTFLKENEVFVSDNNDYLMSTFSVGDLNHDGYLDIYSATRLDDTDDILWINEHSDNNNHFFAVNLVGDSSNTNALGAKLELYGNWGIQTREVRSGESYGIMNSFTQIFGVDSLDCNDPLECVDSLVVKWPSGLREVFESPKIDQFLTIVENDCAYPGKNIFFNGITTICSGDTMELVAPIGETYLWSNGTSNQQLLVTEGGEYIVTVTNDEGCSTVSNAISIVQDPDETPIISASGPTTFCAGGSVILFSSEAESYLWSNNKTSSSTVIFQSGEYTVTVPGFCQDFTSEPVVVNIVEHPEEPEVAHDTIIDANSGVVFLSAIGNNVKWYYEMDSDEPFWEGETFDTLIYKTIVFYVEAENEEDGVVCQSDRVPVWGVVNITSVLNIEEFEHIEVFPNPANHKLIIDFKRGVSSELEINLLDVNGKLVFSKHVEANNNPFLESISLPAFPSGVYTLSIISSENRFVKKIIIQND